MRLCQETLVGSGFDRAARRGSYSGHAHSYSLRRVIAQRSFVKAGLKENFFGIRNPLPASVVITYN